MTKGNQARRIAVFSALAAGVGIGMRSIVDLKGDDYYDDAVRAYTGGRSRGKQTKPKKRRNMLTVSKRVRRKHRRAA